MMTSPGLNLLDDIERVYGGKTALSDSNFFEAAKLPVPEKEEYTSTSDCGYLIFLNDAASVIRFSHPKHCPRIVHDHILQPFGSKIIKKLRVDFIPGVNECTSYQEARELSIRLSGSGIDFYDEHEVNCGYIPNLQIDKKHIVVIDYGACDVLHNSVSKIKETLLKILKRTKLDTYPTPVQSQHYKSLIEAFKEAWPENQKNPGDLRKLWDTCRTLKQEGTLAAPWITDEFERNHGNFKNIVNGSRLYAERLTASLRK